MKNANDFKNFEDEIIKLSIKQNAQKEIDFDNIEIDKEIEDLKQDFIDDLAIYINLINKFKLIESPSYQFNKILTSLKKFLSLENQFIKLRNENNKNYSIYDSLKKDSISSIQNFNKNNETDTSIKENENKNKTSSLNNINQKKSEFEKYNLNNTSMSEKKNKSFNQINKPILNTNKKLNKSKINEINKNIIYENVDGYVFEQNSINFMKYALFANFSNNQVSIPGTIQMDELYEKLKDTNLTNIFVKPYKKSIKFDMTISGLKKKEIIRLNNIFNNNIFLQEFLKLDENDDEENFDILFEVAINLHKQSQDKYYQINTYSILLQILNKLNKKNSIDFNFNKKDEINNRLCKILKISTTNEKIFFLITNGSYLVISNLIKLFKLKKENKLSTNENDNIKKIFNKYKNHRNDKNTQKFFEILSLLEKNKIKFCILYISDEVGNIIDQEYFNKIKLILKYQDKNSDTNINFNFSGFKNSIINNENQIINYILIKEKINEFLNKLITEEANLNNEIKLYTENFLKNESFKDLFDVLMKQLFDKILYNYLKQFNLTILIPKNKKIEVDLDLKKIVTINYSENSLNEIFIENYNEAFKILNYVKNIHFINDKNDDSLFYYNRDKILNMKNIIDKIEYDLKKIFNFECKLNVEEKELNILKYNDNNIEDKNFFIKIEKLCNEILNNSFIKNILKNNLNLDNKNMLTLLVENLKCFNFYYYFLRHFIQKFINRINVISTAILNINTSIFL